MGLIQRGKLACNGFQLSDYDEWKDIEEEELKKQGFQLDGIDEELFVQDIENLDLDGKNTDYMNPKRLFEMLRDSGVFFDTDKFEVMEAYELFNLFGLK